MTATRIHPYRNSSVEPFSRDNWNTDYYDGAPQFVPGRGSLLLVPCSSSNPHHNVPSNECVLITCSSYCQNNADFPFVAFFISNDTDIGLLIQSGDYLGAYYSAPHNNVCAQRTLLMHSHYIELVEFGRRNCFQLIEEDEEDEEDEDDDEDDEDEVTIITPPVPPSSPCSPNHQVSSSLRHHPPTSAIPPLSPSAQISSSTTPLLPTNPLQ
jgi:hypothetical protein